MYAGHTLGMNSDNLQASCYTNLQFCQMMCISLIACLINLLQRLLEITTRHYAKLEHLCHTVVHWHKLGKMENECVLYNSIVLAIFLPKIIEIGENFTYWVVMTKTILTVFLKHSVEINRLIVINFCSQSEDHENCWIQPLAVTVFFAS